MKLAEIKNNDEYLTALGRFEEIFQAAKGTPECDESDVLATLLKKYEEQYHVIDYAVVPGR